MTPSKDAVAGLIYVPMSIKPELSIQECDDWYNNEHVPIRMRLPYFQNGYRYRAIHGGAWGTSGVESFDWLALYDISDMWQVTEEKYNRLLTPSVQSSREKDILNKVAAFRQYYDLVSTYEAPEYTAMEDIICQGDFDEAHGSTLIVVGVKLHGNGAEAEKEWDRWYEEDHLPPLRKVPGWRRTRRYRTSVIEDHVGSGVEFLTLNEFAKGAVIGGPEHQVAIRTEERTTVVASKWRQSYRLHYLQGKTSRDLGALQQKSQFHFISPDGMTRTFSCPTPAIESYITVDGGAISLYRLEGAVMPESPVIVLCTLAGLSWNVWNTLVKSVQSSSTVNQYRILRLQIPIRPRYMDHALEEFATKDLISGDILACLRTLMIKRAVLLLGVGLGGQTTQNAASGLVEYNYEQLHPQLRSLCGNGLFVVSNSRDHLERTIGTAGEVLGGLSIIEWMKDALAKLK